MNAPRQCLEQVRIEAGTHAESIDARSPQTVSRSPRSVFRINLQCNFRIFIYTKRIA